MELLIQILFIAFNIWMAKYHSRLIAANKKINHTLWATIYAVPAIATIFFFSWLLPISLILLRLPVFNTALNLFRHKPFFYVGKESKIDQLVDKHYPYVFIGCIIIFIILEIFILK